MFWKLLTNYERYTYKIMMKCDMRLPKIIQNCSHKIIENYHRIPSEIQEDSHKIIEELDSLRIFIEILT